MGHRGSFAVVKGGQTQLFRSQWGGMNVVKSFFFGPELGGEYCESLEPVDYLLEDFWCEGVALLDWDARLLLFFEGHTSYRPELRKYLLSLMQYNWPGWELRWAGGDIAEIAIRLGIDPGLVRTIDDDDFDIYEETPEWDATPGWIGSILTVADGDLIRDYGFECGITNLLTVGPPLFEHLQDCSTLIWSLSDMKDLENGALINPKKWEIDLWFELRMDNERIERIRRHWPGWTIRRHDAGLSRHLELSDRDPKIGRIGEEAAILEITRLLFEDDTFDPSKFLEQLNSSGEEVQFVHPGFLKTDRPVGDATMKQEMFRRALSRYREVRAASS